jgi:hypothetical protein
VASVVVAVEAVEAGGVAEDHACLGEACLAAKVEPGGSGLREVAGGDVMVDLLPLVPGHEGPGGAVHAPESFEIALAVLAIGQGRLVDHQHLARRAVNCLKQVELAVGREVMDREAAPRRIGGFRTPLQSRDEVAMIELDREGDAGKVLGRKLKRGCERSMP